MAMKNGTESKLLGKHFNETEKNLRKTFHNDLGEVQAALWQRESRHIIEFLKSSGIWLVVMMMARVLHFFVWLKRTFPCKIQIWPFVTIMSWCVW